MRGGSSCFPAVAKFGAVGAGNGSSWICRYGGLSSSANIDRNVWSSNAVSADKRTIASYDEDEKLTFRVNFLDGGYKDLSQEEVEATLVELSAAQASGQRRVVRVTFAHVV